MIYLNFDFSISLVGLAQQNITTVITQNLSLLNTWSTEIELKLNFTKT